jgi:hypothetical protein
MGLFGQYPGTLFRQAGGPALALMPISADYFFGPGAELMRPAHLAASVCAPYADGAHLTHSLPRLREASIAE